MSFSTLVLENLWIILSDLWFNPYILHVDHFVLFLYVFPRLQSWLRATKGLSKLHSTCRFVDVSCYSCFREFWIISSDLNFKPYILHVDYFVLFLYVFLRLQSCLRAPKCLSKINSTCRFVDVFFYSCFR